MRANHHHIKNLQENIADFVTSTMLSTSLTIGKECLITQDEANFNLF